MQTIAALETKYKELVAYHRSMVVVPIRPKESKLERFARMEARRLADRPTPTKCPTCWNMNDKGDGAPCRGCERWRRKISLHRR